MAQEKNEAETAALQSGHFRRSAKKAAFRFLLIDDDKLFGKLMQEVAIQVGVHLEYFSSLVEMGSIGRLTEFDAVILDYFLDGMNGIEIAEYLEGRFACKPLVLVSGRGYGDALMVDSPRCVKAFVHKVRGALTILEKTIEVSSQHSTHFDRYVKSTDIVLPSLKLASN